MHAIKAHTARIAQHRPTVPIPEMTPTARFLLTLNRKAALSGTPVYGGTVPPAEIKARRARNKRAKVARRITRAAA